MAYLTVKRQRASAHQVGNIILLVKIGNQMGANRTQLAGALCTMMQESSCINLKTAVDHDSVGLYQQRPSCNWGSYAQCTTPDYAIRAFLRPYLNYCHQGYGVIEASDKTQGSNFPEAPRQWYAESWKDINIIVAGKDIKDVTIKGVNIGASGLGRPGDAGATDPGTDVTITRELPYEFTRGSPDKRESSWVASGRLADEVKWRRWMRTGALWFASEDWLKTQPVRFTFAQGVRGCLKIDWSADSRRPSADCTVTALAKRWSVTPGDVVQVANEGPADGLWLVKSTRRSIDDNTTEIVLMRSTRRAVEPAPEVKTSTVHVASATNRPKSSGFAVPKVLVSGYNKSNATTVVAKAYNAAQYLTKLNIPYVYGSGHSMATMQSSHPSTLDCSSGVCWILYRAGIHVPGGGVPASGSFESWGLPGLGKYMTIRCNAGHIWIQWHGLGAWRFDTSQYSDSYSGSSGGRLRSGPRPTTSFIPRHWPGT
jgi:hypothetical protein